MSELMRFRLARAPQKHAVNPDMVVSLYGPPAALPQNNEHPFDTIVKELLSNPTAFVPGFQKSGFLVLDKFTVSSTPAARIERWLTSVGNRAEVGDLDAKLREVLKTLDTAAGATFSDNAQLLINLNLPKANWWNERRNVGFSLIVAMVKDKEPSRAAHFNRLMLVFGLIELAARNPASLKDPDAILNALRRRSVLLPRPFMEYVQRGSQWLTSWAQGAT